MTVSCYRSLSQLEKLADVIGKLTRSTQAQHVVHCSATSTARQPTGTVIAEI